MVYSPIIGAYASIFELSVALNFAYASSQQFRATLKTGFLQSITKMDDRYEENIKKIASKISTLDDEYFPEGKKKELKAQLKGRLDVLRKQSNDLEIELEDTQNYLVEKIKPIYVFVAIFSLYCLFLGGQESANNIFPIDGMNSLLIISSFFLVLFYMLSFTKYQLSNFIVIIAILIAITSGMFFPCPQPSIFSHKYLTDMALVVAFLPFMMSMSRLLFLTLLLEFKHRISFLRSSHEILRLSVNCDKLQESTNYFNGD